MEIHKSPAVLAALRTLADGERLKVLAWFDILEHWERDETLRTMVNPTTDPGTYALNTSDDIRIFFKLNEAKGEIVIVDLARPSRFQLAASG